jgi:hypothetical protein
MYVEKQQHVTFSKREQKFSDLYSTSQLGIKQEGNGLYKREIRHRIGRSGEEAFGQGRIAHRHPIILDRILQRLRLTDQHTEAFGASDRRIE